MRVQSKRVTMAGFLHFFILLFLDFQSLHLISAFPDNDTTTVTPDAAFITIESFFLIQFFSLPNIHIDGYDFKCLVDMSKD